MASDLKDLPPEPVQQSALPANDRRGSALCLSGGGYRAALFHLGVCRRLNEVGILSSLDAVSSVSGGSIFAAHFAKCIVDSRKQCFADYEHSIARPFRAFVKNDIRTTPAFARLLPWEWTNAGAGAESLAEQYRKHLVGDMRLSDLPDKPHFNFCATDLVFGVNWVFSKGRVGDYQAGYMTETRSNEQPVSIAVAASSCFPPVFRGLPLGLEPGDLTGGHVPQSAERDEWVRQIALSDGGVYDNMALEPIWKNFASIIVSDGGKPFTFAKESDTPHQLFRIQDVMGNQSEAVRKRWLVANFLNKVYSGAYLGIRNDVTEFPTTGTFGYSKPTALLLSKVRTDMDVFSDAEIEILETHGYTVADAAYKAHIHPGADAPQLVPIHDKWWPLAGHARDGFERRIADALSDSSHVHWLGHRGD